MTLSCCEKLFVLLIGIKLNNVGDFCCLNCFHSFSTENKLERYEKVCNDHDYCCVANKQPNEDNKILKYNYGEKSLKALLIAYADLECLLGKMHLCQNNFEKSYAEKN